MTTYYFSNNGSDKNSGTSSTQAWASLSKTKKLDLQPGDKILLERGSVFDEQMTFIGQHGNEDQPITVSSYGTGAAPVINNPQGQGIYARSSDFFIVEEINMATTKYGGLTASRADNWIVRNMAFDETGGTKYGRADGAIDWSRSHNILVENVTIDDAVGDSVYMQRVSNVIVRDSIFDGVQGEKSDNVQIHGSNIAVMNNVMIAGTGEEVTKGNLVIQNGEGAYLYNNYLEGGGYGASFSHDNVIVDNNIITQHTLYDWSFGVGFTNERNGTKTNNILISNNDFSTAPRGLTIDGGFKSDSHRVYNLEVSDNLFRDWGHEGIYVNRAQVQGSVKNNIHFQEDGALELWNNIHRHANVNLLEQDNNHFEDITDATPATKLIIEASGLSYDGAPVMQVRLNDEVVSEVYVTADADRQETQKFTVWLDHWSSSDNLAISYINDAHGDPAKGEVRDLFVHSVEINGQLVSHLDAELTQKVSVDKQTGDLNFYSNSAAIFDANVLDVPYAGSAGKRVSPELLSTVPDSDVFLMMQEATGNILGAGGNIDVHGFDDASQEFDAIESLISDTFYG